MTEQENQAGTNNQVKEKIRERYKGVGEDVLDVIPAKPQEDFYNPNTMKRVAAYCRVSTDDPHQTSSYELQKNHYEDMIKNRANWELVGIYADEGISGTSLQHRDNFIRMIDDCHAGKIDIIVTKSVSRFARNILDCIGYVRQLKSQDPPIGVFFESENIFTLDQNSEMALSFIATLAQEESHTKSEVMNGSIEMRFKRGIFLTPVLLGYDHDEEGNLIINEEEAKTVRLIFFSYLYGYSAQQIADALTQLERYTKKGNQFWSSGSVLQILSNERYCGDVLARKTFTPNFLDHKSKKNRHDRNQYRQKDHHEPIITREDFFAVQKLIRNAKYGNKGYFPVMHVIKEGILKGFVSIHPKWAGFTEDDYYEASTSINDDNALIPSTPLEIKVHKGNFDLSGYELVRAQFMSTHGQMMLSITDTNLFFNAICIKKMNNPAKVDIFVHPTRKIIAVRKAIENSKHAIQWCKQKDEITIPAHISGAAFIPTLYKLFGWKSGNRYKLIGNAHSKNGETVLIFNATEAYVMADNHPAYPAKWANSFGDEYYKSTALFNEDEPDESWDVDSQGSMYMVPDENVTTREEAADNIKSILGEIGANDE
ncbi:recombinase family protein [Butyrivibrio sp. AC2005]|uniref:recombinase family protein n=1 Tax=Butyrivibrio sp. AC2005 TaxID=1280672 RepID=UPI0003F74C1B|nr:recombinase family protein [Butyrivibrio sp. AC2005]